MSTYRQDRIQHLAVQLDATVKELQELIQPEDKMAFILLANIESKEDLLIAGAGTTPHLTAMLITWMQNDPKASRIILQAALNTESFHQ